MFVTSGMSIQRCFCLVIGFMFAVVLSVAAGRVANADPSILASLPIASGPRQVAVDPVHERLYVVNSGSQSLSVLNTRTLTMTAEWSLGGDIRAIAVDSSTGRLYLAYVAVGNTSEAWDRGTEVWVFDGDSGAFLRGIWFSWVGNGLAVDPVKHRVFMSGNQRASGNGSNSFPRMVALDGDLTAVEQTINDQALASFRALDFDEATRSLYVSYSSRYCDIDCHISVFDPDTLRVVGSAKTGLLVSAVAGDGHGHPIISLRSRVIIGNVGASGSRNVPDPAITLPTTSPTSSTRGSPTDGPPLAVDQRAGIAYLTPQDSSLIVISLNAQVSSIGPSLPQGPHQVTVDSLTHRIYVTSEAADTLTVIQGDGNVALPSP